MSYDVYISDESFNYTYNMSKLFYDHIDGGINALDGRSGKEAAMIIGEAFDRLSSTIHLKWDNDCGIHNFRAHYDSPNKWGSTDGAMVFLGRIMSACMMHPRCKVRVS
ncbi:MAG: hypothetical protein QMD99_25000 [Rhizobiaceae bacterium]|nr:hypothetical protein [Rhizobiaceae bacterium]